MNLFVDNDAILKLGACNLLAEMCELFETAPEEAFVLPSAKYMMRANRRNRLSDKYTHEGLERAMAFANTAREAELPEDRSEYDHLMEVIQKYGLSIDTEALLIAATVSCEDFALVTGDKRAIEALSNAPDCDHIRERLIGRFHCLEQVILLLVNALGFAVIVVRIDPVRHCDGALRLCFSKGTESDQETALEGLRSYIRNLRSRTGALLFSEG